VELVRKLGPYVLVEMLMPGGTLVALAMYFYRQRFSAGRARTDPR
jgi:hypothetical protein